jgi:hypothetical protein
MRSVTHSLHALTAQKWILGNRLVMITVIVPIFNLTPLRKRNLEFVYERLTDANLDVILGIQDESPDLDYYSRFSKAKIVACPSLVPNTFSKGKIFNECVNYVATKFFLFLDADIYIPFKNMPLNEDDEVVKPFSQCVYLDENKTSEFLITKRADVSDDKYKRISCLGGGALIMRTDLAVKEPLFDERFLGWGWEDIDFGDLLRSKFKIRTIDNFAVHLYHEPSAPNDDNYEYYRNKPKPKSKIVHFFHFQVPCEQFLSYVKNKEDGVLLMNCFDVDGLEDDSVKCSLMEVEDVRLERMISLAEPYVEDNGWMIYLDPVVKIEGGFYRMISEEPGNKIIFDDSGKISGIALNKSKFKGFSESIRLDGSHWEKIAILLREQGPLTEFII